MSMEAQLSEIQRSLGRVEGKLDGSLARTETLEEDAVRLEKRMRVLENWRWYMLGAIAFAGALGFTFLK